MGKLDEINQNWYSTLYDGKLYEPDNVTNTNSSFNSVKQSQNSPDHEPVPMDDEAFKNKNVISAVDAASWKDGDEGIDYRPF